MADPVKNFPALCSHQALPTLGGLPTLVIIGPDQITRRRMMLVRDHQLHDPDASLAMVDVWCIPTESLGTGQAIKALVAAIPAEHAQPGQPLSVAGAGHESQVGGQQLFIVPEAQLVEISLTDDPAVAGTGVFEDADQLTAALLALAGNDVSGPAGEVTATIQ